MAGAWPGVIEAHRNRLSCVTTDTPVVTLLEGGTPLIPAPRLARRLGDHVDLYLKHEGLNPTASFKDRGMTVAVSKALERGATAGICASTGNTSASAAAYCARAGIQCAVIIPGGKIAQGKLAQVLRHGAKVFAVQGNFDAALRMVRAICSRTQVALLNSLNPDRIEGQKTAAFEVCDSLGRAPDYHALPVGNAGNITSYWKGYREYHASGQIAALPVMLGFQAAGAAPIVEDRIVENPETVATAIRIGNPARREEATRARDESGGLIQSVTDEEILAAYQLLASTEGIFAEPASAATVAGLCKLAAAGFFESSCGRRGRTVVVGVLTGHGLKDPETALRVDGGVIDVPDSVDAVLEFLQLPERPTTGAAARAEDHCDSKTN
ncbi:MAG: threonine synthase [Armatimonadetes bacterium CG_4_10_14_3_um_filter_66_18]|nr:threonine synthase [Armatimonadota bacterium]OIP12687.1 MAG: threonine synthase [Armatimonadetes bacterium CG2_30_66_41]PIU88390.1 MAG: threonine synthase [Armatimonadetes bacterium CG06_land_8_20_14_3_00_66_21]PIW13448.1 MAG: threonine synthase [Armatimonadetes bacterium CG17_big_fil_post_rev_8_21_14_2_50_66_6]PIX38968.1 MAG: threonine synthase [Armatimonadetes bacterium CG_4_8_14_3_um_filter_66_20]PIY42712.1 MAG: threonine synthase [Armatimonadetes bacterium CG_4_10_14_3_um_filter_66_18]